MRVRHIGPDGAGRRVEVAYVPNGTATSRRSPARAVVLACWHTAHPVHLSRAAGRAEDGARLRDQGAARLHERVHPIVDGLSEAGRAAHLDAGDVAHLGRPRLPGEPRRLQAPDRSRPSRSCCTCRRRRAGRACRCATSTARAGRSCSRPRSRRSSAAFAISWAARSAAADSIRRADILGITVNRWPHGYAYQYNSLSDDFWLDRRRAALRGRAPAVRAHRDRQRRRGRLRLHRLRHRSRAPGGCRNC